MVSDVAAMFVATTTFLTDGLGGSNTLFCNSVKKKIKKKKHLWCLHLQTLRGKFTWINF